MLWTVLAYQRVVRDVVHTDGDVLTTSLNDTARRSALDLLVVVTLAGALEVVRAAAGLAVHGILEAGNGALGDVVDGLAGREGGKADGENRGKLHCD